MSDVESMTPATPSVFPPFVNANYDKHQVTVVLRGNPRVSYGHPHPGPEARATFPREAWNEFIQDCYARWSAGVALGHDKRP